MSDMTPNKISLKDLALKDYETYCKYVSIIEDGHLTWNGIVNCDSTIPKSKLTDISTNQIYNIKIIKENTNFKAVLEESNNASKKN